MFCNLMGKGGRGGVSEVFIYKTSLRWVLRFVHIAAWMLRFFMNTSFSGEVKIFFIEYEKKFQR